VTTLPKCEKYATSSAASTHKMATTLSLRRSDHVLRSAWLDRALVEEEEAPEEEEEAAAAALCADDAEEDVGFP
jgi:HD superfamily phosphohydrolase YqeK